MDFQDLSTSRRCGGSIYDGAGGKWLQITSILSLRQPLMGWLVKKGTINLQCFPHILDVGWGTGQVLGHLVKATSKDARLFGRDLPESVLRGARSRVKDARPRYIVADITHLPFADGSFDCITSGKKLRTACEQVGLVWHREIWYSPIHKFLRIGGIFVETIKPDGQGYSCAYNNTNGSKSPYPTV